MSLKRKDAFHLIFKVCRVAIFVSMVVLLARTTEGQGLAILRGTVKDPSGAVVPNASVTLKAAASDRTESTKTNAGGAYVLSAIPLGRYTLTVEREGFAPQSRSVQILVGGAPVADFVLTVNSATTTVKVNAAAGEIDATASSASSPPVVVSGKDIVEALPGAERMSSLSFITDTTPSAFMLHDHLHVRGGHQVNWLLNGVPIPNTNTSSNVGRSIDPKDIEQVQINRGGYGAQSGDRTYAQVNVYTRSGFEFDNDGELTLGFGSYNRTNDQLNYGGHSAKFAHYISLTGSRTDLGLEPPVMRIDNDIASGEGFFTVLNFHPDNANQYDLTFTIRNDRDQVPVDPSQTSYDSGNVSSYYLNHDVDEEVDSFGVLSWTHTFSQNSLWTVSPLFHYNNARYLSSLTDPLAATSRAISRYFGAQSELKYVHGAHNLTGGIYGFYQQNSQTFGLTDTVPGQTASATVSAAPNGGVGSTYLNDQYKPLHWLTVNAGLRVTHFSGTTSENAANYRGGVSVEIPKVKWVARAYYGTYYQAPPLYTVGGSVFGFELVNEGETGFAFEPLKGERDIQREFGITIPFHGWVADFDLFGTNARNFQDHDMLGNSNILLPLTTPDARMRGTEATLRTPEVMRKLRLHLAFSNMMAQYRGAPDGGLIEPVPDDCVTNYCYLDHDQRNTLTAGFEVQLPYRAWFSNNVVWGSGVVAGDGDTDAHTPAHTTADVELGKDLGERISMRLEALNISNSRYPFSLDNSFAGTHYNNPREIIGSIRYRFHF